MYIDHHLCLLQAVVLQFGEVLTAFPKCSVWGWVPPMAFSVDARSCNAVFSSIDYSFRMRVYYTCHCADLSHPFSLFHLAYAENILGVCLLCQSKKGTGLLLNVDLPTFPVAFFQKYCLGAGWELFLGVQFRVFCAVLQAALSLDELDTAQECAVVPPARESCLSKNSMALSDAQNCEAEYICPGSWFSLLSLFLNLTSWVVAAGCQKYLENGAQILQLSSLRSLCRRYRTYLSLLYLHLCFGSTAGL